MAFSMFLLPVALALAAAVLPSNRFRPWLLPLAGFILLTTRFKALSQVVGYLVLENGIYVLGIAMAAEVPVLVELGVLLDAFVAVFVMQIAIHQIRAEFRSTDVDQLTALKG